MTGKRRATGALFCVICVALTLASALAGNPEFVYTTEKWAQLRDNRLELNEVGDLVHGYNNAVIQSQIGYEEYRGESRGDISRDYYDAADDVCGTVDYPDSSGSDYASRLSSYPNNRTQADELREQGDDSMDNGDTRKLGYNQTRAGLIKQTQSSMIDYQDQTYALKRLEESRFQSQLACESTTTKLGAGMSAQVDLFSVREVVTTVEASAVSADNSLDKTREALYPMLGWAYKANVRVCDVLEPGLKWVEPISLEPDIPLALESSHSLRILKKQIENTVSVGDRESLEQPYKSQRKMASGSVKNACQNLLLAREDYTQASQTHELGKSTMDTAGRKLQANTMTRGACEKQESSLITSEISAQTQKLGPLGAQLDYQWAADGLTSVS